MRFVRSFALGLSLVSALSIPVVRADVPDAPATSAAPASSGRISGVVADPTGAVIPNAVVIATRAGHAPYRTTSDAAGRYSFNGLPPGVYILEASETGFETGHMGNVNVTAGASLNLTLTLAIASDQQSVVVTADQLDTSPEKNGSATVLKGEALAALSDDPDELSTQLQAIAGSDAESGSQLYVDGFSGGRLPPKNSIREIRINQNPYSAQYDQMGFGRIEIFTKPGADRLHGSYWMQGNDSPLNAQNPFVKSQPPYYMYQLDGDINGPATKNSGYFFSLWTRHNVANSIINAEILDADLNPVAYTAAVSTPSSALAISPRFDWQWGTVHTFTARYQYARGSNTNSGVGQFSLASQGTNTSWTQQDVQFTDSQAFSPKVLNEIRFEYSRNTSDQSPVSTDPTVSVQGAFTGGGNGGGRNSDTQNHFELNDLLRITHGSHDIDAGGRLRVVHESNYSTGGYNGSFSFSSITAYQLTEQNLQNCEQHSPDCMTPTDLRAAGGGATYFSQTSGTPTIELSMADAGLFAEDNWKIIPNVTFSYGVRFETQTGIHDHADWAPRFSLAWSIPSSGKMPDIKTPDGKTIPGGPKPPHVILRAGGGFFYTRFGTGGLMQAERQNGVTQTSVVIANPDFFPDTCTTDPADCAQGEQAATAPTIYTLGPKLSAPYLFLASIGGDKTIGKHVQLSVNYFYSRGLRQLLSYNINAPYTGTYNPDDPTSGTRPLGIIKNIYQYTSQGTSTRNRVNVNASYNYKHGGAWGWFTVSKAEGNSNGQGAFPSNEYNVDDDWGRTAWDARVRGAFGGYARLPGGIGFNPFLTFQTETPFNLTVDQDLNGDSQFNDRPAFATDLTRPSVYRTKWGDFDADPIAGQKIVPYNYGTGFGQFGMNLDINKRFNFGPALPDENPQPAGAKPAASTPGAKQSKPEIDRKYTLAFGVRAENVTNHPSYTNPVGVLGSSLFGTSTSVNAVAGNNTNRAISFETFFRF